MSDSPLTAGQEIRVLSLDRALQLHSSITYSTSREPVDVDGLVADAAKIETFIRGPQQGKAPRPEPDLSDDDSTKLAGAYT